MRTNDQTETDMMKLIFAFRNFENNLHIDLLVFKYRQTACVPFLLHFLCAAVETDGATVLRCKVSTDKSTLKLIF